MTADSEPLHLTAFQRALAEEGVVLERDEWAQGAGAKLTGARGAKPLVVVITCDCHALTVSPGSGRPRSPGSSSMIKTRRPRSRSLTTIRYW